MPGDMRLQERRPRLAQGGFPGFVPIWGQEWGEEVQKENRRGKLKVELGRVSLAAGGGDGGWKGEGRGAGGGGGGEVETGASTGVGA